MTTEPLTADQFELHPTRWYHPTASSGPVPCRWEGWVTLGAAAGRVWVVVDLMDGDAP